MRVLHVAWKQDCIHFLLFMCMFVIICLFCMCAFCMSYISAWYREPPPKKLSIAMRVLHMAWEQDCMNFLLFMCIFEFVCIIYAGVRFACFIYLLGKQDLLSSLTTSSQILQKAKKHDPNFIRIHCQLFHLCSK